MILCPIKFYAQDTLPSYSTQRTTESIKIDGVLDENIWSSVPKAGNFIQNQPTEGIAARFKSEFMIVYDDEAIYFAGILYDPSPDSILTELSERDPDNDINADQIRFLIDPYNSRQDAFEFSVYASGVQADYKFSDWTFDAVWESAAHINELGWIVEIKIPYSAIRFPDDLNKPWALQVTRSVRRYRSFDQWALTPNKEGNSLRFWGNLIGIRDIKTPVRLSFTPYASVFVERSPVYDNEGNYSYGNSYAYNAGADLKYGIDDRFTLDLTLLPDFSQVQSDRKFVTLGFEEINYDENRPFFQEATDLFNKNGLFYSRRIGQTPSGNSNAYDATDSTETVIENPSASKLLNAFKISGRNNAKLGMGIFNAITNKTYATIENNRGEKRDVLTEPLINYNVLVLDQQLKNSSTIYLINANTNRLDNDYDDANVTGTGFYLLNKKSTYAIGGEGAYSYIKHGDNSSTNSTNGYKYFLILEKTSGNFRFNFSRNTISDDYRQSDLGYYVTTDRTRHNANFQYNIYTAKWFLINSYNNINFNYENHFQSGDRTRFQINWNSFFTHKSYNGFFFGGGFTPIDYVTYDPRTNGKAADGMRFFYVYGGVSSDYRKKLAVDLEINVSNFLDHYKMEGYNFGPRIRYRFNDKLTLRTEFNYNYDPFNFGYASSDEDGNSIFGGRILNTYVSGISGKYIFNNNVSLSVFARHYWFTAQYRKFFTLKDDGSYVDNYAFDDDIDLNVNFFNVDFVFSWRFAPGSDLLLTYKNSIDVFENEVSKNFGKNFDQMIGSPQTNSISLKILYYHDYNRLQLFKRKKTKSPTE